MKNLMFILSAALFPAFAWSEVKLYGTVKSGISVSRIQTSGNPKHTRTTINDLGSHICIRGSHRIGGQSSEWEQASENEHAKKPLSMRERTRQKKEAGFLKPDD
ncbi:hypothetical protein [Neisseria sp. 83E34]|uniref:hypothetical protein n=1 Tax=Neisseria sp. 83E34 TaxID=1692264 RepID=UPI0006D99DEF|nr:hypothetical protein [Neisseria sp. 83E34]KPN72035.1 hypothetical protein AKG09_04650 [Neisseria sp. 83E34]